MHGAEAAASSMPRLVDRIIVRFASHRVTGGGSTLNASMLYFAQSGNKTTAGTDMARQTLQPLTSDTLKNFRIIYGSVRKHFREVEKACGISGSQLWILQEVASTPNVGVSELADRLSIHQSTCSQLVEKLVVGKLLVKLRDTEDQRRVGLTLTPRGQRVVAKAPQPAEGVFPKMLQSMGRKDLTELNHALGKVIRQLRLSEDKYSSRPLSDL
jgi:DNA-binding MarR family transcriptional regulator